MPKGKRASPAPNRGIGDNSGYPDLGDVRVALAIETIFEEREKKLREEKKLARKKIEAMKVRLDDTNFLKGLREMSGSEVIEEFKRRWHLVGAVHQDQAEQLDIFAPKPSAPERRAAHYAMGMLAAITGKELVIPPGTATDDINRMTDGFNDGKASREQANALILGKALDNAKAGKVTDGKTGEAVVSPVGEKAAQDFAEDQAVAGADDPLVVNGERYATVRQANAARRRLSEQGGAPAQTVEHVVTGEGAGGGGESFLNDTTTAVVGDEVQAPAGEDLIKEEIVAPAAEPVKKTVLRPDFHNWGEDWATWNAGQLMEFKRWFESLDEDHPAPSHEGASAYFKLLREEVENRRLEAADEDEGEAPAPEPEPEVDLSEDAIKAKAAALAESGFVKSKAARRTKAT